MFPKCICHCLCICLFIGKAMSPRHFDQMSHRSQVSFLTCLYVPKSKVSDAYWAVLRLCLDSCRMTLERFWNIILGTTSSLVFTVCGPFLVRLACHSINPVRWKSFWCDSNLWGCWVSMSMPVTSKSLSMWIWLKMMAKSPRNQKNGSIL